MAFLNGRFDTCGEGVMLWDVVAVLVRDDEVEPYCSLHEGFLFIDQFFFPLGGGGGGGGGGEGGAYVVAATCSWSCAYFDVDEFINGVRQDRFRLDVFNQDGKLLSNLASKNKYFCSGDFLTVFF